MHLPKTDAIDRTHGNDANVQGQIANKVNASFWESALKDQFKSVVFEWVIPEKKQTGGLRILFWKKPLEFLLFFSVPLEIPGKIKLHYWKFGKIMYIPRKLKAKNSRTLEISHEFVLVSLGNSTLFLINPWKFCILFLVYSWKFSISSPSPPVWIFSGIVQSRRPCTGSNTFQYIRMKITYHHLLAHFFHKLISVQDIGHNMLHLNIDQQLPSL